MKGLKLVFVCLLTLLLVACGKTMEEKWQEKYDLGMRYLTEGSYEEAILAFTAAIEIDSMLADAYIYMAEAYWEQEDYESAQAILQQGLDVIASEELKLQLKANELNIKLRQDAAFARLFDGLYEAFENQDRDKLGDFLEATMDADDFESSFDADKLVFDGNRFHTQDGRKGITFLWGNGSFFYGQCDEDGYPHGKGIYVVVHTGGFGNASLGYNWYDGEWDHGTIVGEAKIWDEFTKSWDPELQGRHGRKEITCTFGEDEIMTDATFIETIYGNGAFHQVTFHIVNGKYVPSEWGGNYNRPCELHSDCGITFGVTEFGSELYRNPFSFVREEDIDFPKLYGGWNLSFGGLRD